MNEMNEISNQSLSQRQSCIGRPKSNSEKRNKTLILLPSNLLLIKEIYQSVKMKQPYVHETIVSIFGQYETGKAKSFEIL